MSILQSVTANDDPQLMDGHPNWDVEPILTRRSRRYFGFRSVADRLFAVVLLVPGLPLIFLLGLIVRLTSRGPAIHSQSRVGKEGRPFRIYKIRTMIDNAEKKTGVVWTKPNDPRITHIGAVLRKLHLDELPQLFNVLRGDMSLIGPRPERPEFVEVLSQEIPDYLNRLAVRPGITGLAQVHLPPDTDLQSVRRKLTLDLEYIDQAGPFLDLRLLLCSALRIVGVPGDSAMHACVLRRPAIVSDDHSLPADSIIHTPGGIIVPPPHQKAGKLNGHSRRTAKTRR
ncbi:MAG: sugar transferase [Pirellulales bacterium]|nr:sugar transferase [Pirellulales bacterium]